MGDASLVFRVWSCSSHCFGQAITIPTTNSTAAIKSEMIWIWTRENYNKSYIENPLNKDRGPAQHRGSICTSHPAAPEFKSRLWQPRFLLYCLVCGQQRHWTHVVLTQMQLSAKAWAKNYKKAVLKSSGSTSATSWSSEGLLDADEDGNPDSPPIMSSPSCLKIYICCIYRLS